MDPETSSADRLSQDFSSDLSMQDKPRKHLCLVCKKEVLIIYPDHPDLHSSCRDQWARLSSESQAVAREELRARSRLDSSNKTSSNTSFSTLSPTLSWNTSSAVASKKSMCLFCWQEIFLRFDEHPNMHSACFGRFKRGEAALPMPKPATPAPASVPLGPNLRRSTPSSKKASLPSKHSSKAAQNPGARPHNPLELPDYILACKSYYHIFNVSPTAELETIRASFKQLALAVHPDRNEHPNSTEAFKKVVQAWECLNDPEKRAKYDLNGTEDSAVEMDPRMAAEVERWRIVLLAELFNSLSNMVLNVLPFK